MKTVTFVINIILWYVFTLLSTIYSKKYLNHAHDAFTLTFVVFIYSGLLKLARASSIQDLADLLINYDYLYLSVFNIGTILLTNIGINETSISLTYMVKSTEPLFVLLLSYYILEESQQLKVRLALLPICLGVSLIVYGELSLNLTGFLCAFSANLSSASRNVFIKSKLKQSDASNKHKKSAFTTYLNIGFVSLVLFLPIYILKLSYHHDVNVFSRSSGFDCLIYGSLFNFLYNLFSLSVLSNVATISHSIINIMKRVFVVFVSMLAFNTHVTLLQWCGMICADVGVFLYSMLKIRSHVVNVSISNERKSLFRNLCLYLVVFISIGSIFITRSNYDYNEPDKNSKNSKEIMRLKCIQNIQENIKSVAKNLIPTNGIVHLLDIPEHDNYGDTLIWLGEEQLFKELGVTITSRILSYDQTLFSRAKLSAIISPSDTILLHGGGNFGDLYRLHTDIRNFIISNFPRNRIVILPQTINYRKKDLALADNRIYSNASDLTIMVRSLDSFEFARSVFPKVKTVFVPDAAFMLGNLVPFEEPKVDIFVICRIDMERRFDFDVWSGLIRKKVGNKYTFLIRDWTDYEDVRNSKTTLKKVAGKRFTLVNKIISQGRVIISDRLHASIMSVLMGKSHVIINDKFNKIYNARESAFRGMSSSECSPHNLRGYYADNIEEAVVIAISLLNEENI